MAYCTFKIQDWLYSAALWMWHWILFWSSIFLLNSKDRHKSMNHQINIICKSWWKLFLHVSAVLCIKCLWSGPTRDEGWLVLVRCVFASWWPVSGFLRQCVQVFLRESRRMMTLSFLLLAIAVLSTCRTNTAWVPACTCPGVTWLTHLDPVD